MEYVIKDFALAPDPWRYAQAEGSIGAGDVVVPLARWLECSDELIQRRGRNGVTLATDDDVGALTVHLDGLDLVVIEVPSIGDGRCYSMARLIRERHGYGGELRARGAFLIDQMQFMQRCGFNAFDPAGVTDTVEALWALSTFSVFYQPAADDVEPASTLRRRDRLLAHRKNRAFDEKGVRAFGS